MYIYSNTTIILVIIQLSLFYSTDHTPSSDKMNISGLAPYLSILANIIIINYYIHKLHINHFQGGQ